MNITKKTSVTFVVFTFNEASRIERVVKNLRGSGPVLVVDNHSTDDTRAIAEREGARVIVNQNPGWVEDENTARVVKDAVDTPWIYWGYADEMLSESTLKHLLSKVRSERYDILSIGKKNYFYGRFCERAFSGGALPRLFRKDAIDFTGNVIHHFGRVTVPADRIYHVDPERFFTHQFISHSTGTMLGNLDRYSFIESRQGEAPHPLRFLIRLIKAFTVNYFFRRGYRAGREGFFYCFYNIIYDIFLAMRKFERENGFDRQSIERRNDIYRDRILDEQAEDATGDFTGIRAPLETK